MEDQVEYKIRERQFHGEYISVKEDKLKKNHEPSAIILGYILGIAFGIAVIIGIYFIGSWIINLIQAL